jgi:hypothetical protein
VRAYAARDGRLALQRPGLRVPRDTGVGRVLAVRVPFLVLRLLRDQAVAERQVEFLEGLP